jgi:hypothetical protein
MEADEPSKPLPFTRMPEIQADIRRELRQLLEEAETGRVRGLFLVWVDENDLVTSNVLGERKYTLIGAATVALTHNSMKIATGKI